jgi:hypothetical protein
MNQPALPAASIARMASFRLAGGFVPSKADLAANLRENGWKFALARRQRQRGPRIFSSRLIFQAETKIPRAPWLILVGLRCLLFR